MSASENPPRIFLSYTRKDTANVKELYKKLKLAGYHPWMDIEDILPGQDWEQVLIKAINDAVFFLACLSTNSIDHRGVVQQEIKHALQVWRRKLDDDIYFIPIRLNDCQVPEALAKFNWVDLFQEHGFSRLLAALRKQVERLGYVQKIALRSRLVYDLTKEEVVKVLKEKDLYDNSRNWSGKGVKHQYEIVEQTGNKLIIDHTTGLVWQQSGSSEKMKYIHAEDHICDMNEQKFAGYNDWRMPTLEEAVSLMEPKKSEQGLYINPVFNWQLRWIWTADSPKPGVVAWIVNFYYGDCRVYYIGKHVPYSCLALRTIDHLTI